jgi:hypothetical protein
MKDKDADGVHHDAAGNDSAKGGVGDVEAAGETTAAEMIGGPPDTRPVGLDTIANVKISDTPKPTEDDKT